MTKFNLTWGAMGVVEPSQGREFEAQNFNDAVTRFAERVVELDQNPDVGAGWVHLDQVEPERHVLAWTKTSNETPTSEGLTY